MSVAARIAVGLDLFSLISAKAESVSSKELAKASGGEPALIRKFALFFQIISYLSSKDRVLRLLASAEFVKEVEEDKWSANSTTKAMATAPIAAGHRMVFDLLISSVIKAPKFLRETGYKCPTEPTDGFIQYANQTKLSVFDFFMTTPSLFQDFNMFMGNTLGSREYWHDWYDVPGRLLHGFDTAHSSALLVDVGGGKGHDVQAFHDQFKEHGYKGELILEDQQEVLDAIPDTALNKSIKKIVQDFFAPQKIRGMSSSK